MRTAPRTSLPCSAFCALSTAAISSPWSSSTTWPSAPAAISASPCAAPPICMPGPTPPAICCGAPTTGCNSPSSTAPLPLRTRSCCASLAAPTSPSLCSSTVPPPRRPRSPRRCAPPWPAPASPSPGPCSGNACASTTPASGSPSKLSNSAASPSAAPPAGTCQPDRRCLLASTPLFRCSPFRTRDALGTERSPPTLRATYRATTSAGGAQRNTSTEWKLLRRARYVRLRSQYRFAAARGRARPRQNCDWNYICSISLLYCSTVVSISRIISRMSGLDNGLFP